MFLDWWYLQVLGGWQHAPFLCCCVAILYNCNSSNGVRRATIHKPYHNITTITSWIRTWRKILEEKNPQSKQVFGHEWQEKWKECTAGAMKLLEHSAKAKTSSKHVLLPIVFFRVPLNSQIFLPILRTA